MNKIIATFCIFTLLVSCNKEDHDENKCPTVTRSGVPSNALSNFDSKYDGATDVVWFYTDSKEFTAVFDLNGEEYEVQYDSTGNFISEEIEVENELEGENEDEDENEGCECDRDDDDEHED